MLYRTPREPRAGGLITAEYGRNLIRAIRSAMPGPSPGMLIRHGFDGSSVMATEQWRSVVATSSATIEPFTVRWFSWDDGSQPDKGQWQIYLPLGCATLTQGYDIRMFLPVNENAKDADGNDISDWYAIEQPDDAYSYTIVEGDRVVQCWAVYLEMKPWPRLKVSTNPSDFAPMAWVKAVAELRVVDYGEGETKTRSAVRTADGIRVEKTWDISLPFSVMYVMPEGSETDRNAKPNVMLTMQDRFIGRLQETVYPDTNITGWNNVWVKIVHDGETFELSVEDDLTGAEARSDDNQTVYKIYDLSEDIVTADLRASVPVMDFYTTVASVNGS